MSRPKNKPCTSCGKLVTVGPRCHACARREDAAKKRALLTPPNPSGLCQCGCGQPTKIAAYTLSHAGWVMGHPVRFIKGHENRPSQNRYIVNPDTGCWEWQWMTDTAGYGRWQYKSRCQPAHRVMYEIHKGPIPKGLHLDHLCRNPRCVNPDHLEPVTHTENVRRGANAKITMALAEDIRRLYASGEHTQLEISRMFGVTQATVSKIVLHRSWAPDS